MQIVPLRCWHTLPNTRLMSAPHPDPAGLSRGSQTSLYIPHWSPDHSVDTFPTS